MRLLPALLLLACAEEATVSALPDTSPPPLELARPFLWRGNPGALRLDGARPNELVTFYGSTVGPGAGPCAPAGCLGILQPINLAVAVADADGRAEATWSVPPNLAAVWVQAGHADGTVSDVEAAQLYAADHDEDRDGLTDVEEFQAGTDWQRRDPDGDNANDFDELAMGTDPWDPDTDDDLVRDGREHVYNCDPLNPDTDGDGRVDGEDMFCTRVDPVDPFVVDEIYATDPAMTVPDPEFDEQLGRAAWQTLSGSQIWVADVDPATGRFVPYDGRGALIDTDIAPMSFGKNGPEWAFHDTGSDVLYTRRDGGVLDLWAASWDGATWTRRRLGASEGEASPIGSLDRNDPTPRLRWLYADRTGVMRFGWRELRDPTTDHEAPVFLRFTRHVPGTDLIVGTAIKGGVEQVFTYDPRSRTYEQLSRGALSKGSVFFVAAPELGGELIFFVTVGDRTGDPVQMATYRQIGGRWQEVKRITSPPGFPYIVSPEPLVANGRSYVSFLASKEPLNEDNGTATVWVVDMLPTSRFYRRISSLDAMVRKDPEPYTGGDRPWVFYTEVRPDGTRRVIRAETGL